MGAGCCRQKQTNGTAARVAIAVTAPHAYCPSPSSPGHVCDSVAGPAATALQAALPAPTRLFVNREVPRSTADLNRNVARDKGFRPALSRWMQDQERFGVIDVHSFPAQGDPWSDADANGAELVLLSNRHQEDVEGRVLTRLRQRGVRVAVLEAHPTVNDIDLEAQERGAEWTLLLEFNEGVAKERIQRIAQTIASAFV